VPDAERVDVLLMDLPVPVWARAREHGEGLLREMQLMLVKSEAKGHPLPRRLAELVATLTERYAGVADIQTEQIRAAHTRGLRQIDVAYPLPRSARADIEALSTMFDEVDEFCRAGELLTLATPPEAVAFRKWYFGEIIRQLDGELPTSWVEWRSAHGGSTP
jgi:hypothetical protein